MEKIAARTRSIVGLTRDVGLLRRIPLADPAITRIEKKAKVCWLEILEKFI
jgi:hypothetical protein